MALVLQFLVPLLTLFLLDSVVAQSCQSGWVSNTDSCYKFVARSLTVKGLTWENAEIKCQSYGGHLVSIANQLEQNFITSRTRRFVYEHFWIGYNDRANESYFNWTDGLKGTNYTNWRTGEPNDFLKREDCVEMVARSGFWNDEYCANEYSYICKRSKGAPWPTQGTVIPPATSTPIYCGAGWDNYGTSCYMFSTVVKTWTAAMKYCRESGGYLVKVDNANEQHYLSYRLRMLKQPMWIGLTDRAVEGTYVWIGDKSPLNYTNWFPGEPNDFSGNEDCIQMLNGYWGGFWNDNYCGKTRTFICEKPFGKDLCPANWVPFGDSCLEFNTHPAQALTWGQARASCRITKGADLISIHSQDEQSLLLQMLKDLRAGNVWIGLNDITKEGLFAWSDRSTLDYKNWSPSEPGSDALAANKDCVVLVTNTDNGTWATTNCSYLRTYVCRRNRGYDQCNSPLGMQNLQIADSQITASSSKDSQSVPSQARLKIQPTISTSGAWCAKNNKKGEYLQIDLGLIRQITHIAVQGRPTSTDFVKYFYLRYGNDGKTFINYGENTTQSYQILKGSSNSDAITNIMLSETINCRFIRIYPIQWNNTICMRTEIYGCDGQATSSKCKSGWEEGPDNTCYQFNTNQFKIWADARATCTSQDGDLLSIVTNNERIYIDNRLKSLVNSVSSLWIGLNDRESNRLFYWSDRSPYVVTRWDSGYPKDRTNGKSCVELVPSRAAWRDVDCGQYKPFICKKKLASPHTKKFSKTADWISATDAYWPLNKLVEGKALGTSPAQVVGNVAKATVLQNTRSALQFQMYNSYLNAGDYPNQCIGDTDFCNAGLSVSLIFNLDAPSSTWTSRRFLVDSIGDKTWTTSRGFAIYIEQAQVKVMLMTTTTSWSVSTPISRGAWHHVVFTWIPTGAGLQLYLDGKPKASDSTGRTLIPTHGATNFYGLTIGSKTSTTAQGVYFMRSLGIWYRALDPSEITDIFTSEFGKCRVGWKEFGQFCYQFNNAKRNWPSARTQCQNQGGDLVSITSPVEQSHISMEVSYFGLSKFAWIGFHDRTLESVWEWSDGSPVRFTNWFNYQPDNWFTHGEDCGHTYMEFSRVGRWNDIDCGTNMAYICKRKKEYSPAGGVTPTMGPRRLIVCEWASDILSCPTSTVISVQSANYGRTDPGLCAKISITNCRLNVTQKIQSMCDGQAFCSVRPTNALFGKDPCKTIYKYLDVTYVCKPGIVNTPGCSEGWQRSPDGWTCFDLMMDKKNWFDARDSCRRYGAELGGIHNGLACSLMTSLLVKSWDAGDVWIGLSDYSQRGVYRWADSHPVRFTNWWNGEPNDRNANGSCVRATLTASNRDWMYWVDSDCNLKLAYVCYKYRQNVSKPTAAPTIIPTTSCPAGWKAYKMGCYRLFTQTKTWTSARDSCRTYKNTVLVSIHDNAESVFIQGLLNNTLYYNAWIGLNDRGPITGHVWVDGTPVDFTKWGPLQPDSHSGQQPCVVTTATSYWNDVGCYSTRPYICKMKRPLRPLTTAKPTAPPLVPTVVPWTCDSGWKYWRQMCYYFSKQSLSNYKTWFDSRTVCRQAGGDLASILSAAENAYISSVLRGYRYAYMWIGLSDLGSEGSYEWSDGSPLSYTNYNWREPNNWNGQEDCIHMWKSNGLWNDNLCNRKMPFVCKKHNNTYTPATTVPPTPGPALGRCNPGWVHYDRSCYKFVGDEIQNWPNARARCEKGTNDSAVGELVSINNQYEQAFISSMMKADYTYKNGFWIGLNDRHTENLFSWVNNDQVTYTNWNARQPIRNWRLDCVDLVPGNAGLGRWRVKPCSWRLGYICETAALPLGPTSVTPSSSPDCPAQFIKYGYACYSMFYTKLTWKEAREVCSKYENGDIISIHSVYEQAFLLQNMLNFPGDVWTGLSRDPNSPEFKWSDRSVKEYTHWARGQPGKPGSKRTCVQSSNSANNDGRWMEVDCNKKNGFMCRIYKGEPHVTPILQGTCLPGFKKFDKFCYQFRLYDKRSWAEARFRCNKAGGDLVSVLNRQETDFLIYQTKELRFATMLWIGLNDRIVERGYQWSDGSPVSFVSWGWRQPDDSQGRQNCVAFYSVNGKWYDSPCFWRRGYICKSKLECSLPLGMANYNITNQQLTASSLLNSAHAPGMARINGSSGWCANASTKGQYFEVDFRNQMEITKISIKGITLFKMAAFIRTFTVSYGTYKNQWQPYKVNGATRVFSANWDSKAVVTLAVDPPIPARFLRIQPMAWSFTICAKFEFYGCAFECRKPLGIGSGLIYDKLINASSQIDTAHGPLQARPTSGQGWCPKTDDKNPSIQVTWPGFAKRLTKIATWGVGAGKGGGYVTKYKLAFSDNGYVWKEYSEKGLVRIFRGNSDPVTRLVHVLGEPIKTQYFRIMPLAGSSAGKCLRFELYGCASGCNDALGMEKGTIEDSWVTSSSYLDSQHRPSLARLNGPAGWCAATNDKNQYLQIDLGRMYRIRQVATQGTQDGFVKTYFIRTFFKIWQYYTFKDSKTLVANADGTSVVLTTLYSPRRARLVQILPQSWSKRICMRVEIYGCIPNDAPTIGPPTVKSTASEIIPTTLPRDLSFEVKMKITNVPWKDNYSDRTSTDFKNLANKVISEVTALYNKGKDDIASLAFQNVKIISFKKGSVIVDFNITFFSDIAQGIDVTQRIKESAKKGSLGSLTVDPESLTITKIESSGGKIGAQKGGRGSGLSTGAKAAIGVVVVLVILSGLLIFGWWFRKKYRRGDLIMKQQAFENPIHFSSQAYDIDE